MPAVKPSFCRLNRQVPLAQGVLAAWPFHEGNGTVAYDVSGRGNNGTLTNMSATPSSTSGWWYGVSGYTLAFDGSTSPTNDYVDIGTKDIFNFADGIYTVGLQYQASSTGGTQVLVGKRSPATGEGYIIRIANAGTFIGRTLNSGSVVSAERTSVSTTCLDGNSHTIVVVFKTDTVTSGNNDVTLYYDGKLDQGSLTNAGTYLAPTGISARIGCQSDDASALKGKIDCVVFWNRGLSANEAERFHSNPFEIYQPIRILKGFPIAAPVVAQGPRRARLGVGI